MNKLITVRKAPHPRMYPTFYWIHGDKKGCPVLKDLKLSWRSTVLGFVINTKHHQSVVQFRRWSAG